ncbi:Uma2 family endonuclease [Micromonospora sp. WMMD734]|uniref:Uma2 family endonuclease n=1 Tax=Micromonospora sp. WMMD734 TaxID=3404129 RepID=UPI003B93729A
MTAVPEWMRPPRPEGWYADDLDTLTEAPRHTELIDGALVFMMSPQRVWHARIVTALVNALTDQAPSGVEVDREITVRLDRWNRPEPGLVAAAAPYDPSRTFYTPEETLLVVEVVSPESAHRDRTVKLRKYAEAGIANYWPSRRRTAHLWSTPTNWTCRHGPTWRPESIATNCGPRSRS